MQPIPNNTIVYYASNEPKYTGSVGIITSGFISPKSEILTQKVKFTFGTFLHEFTHLHEVKKFTDKQKQSLEKLKLIHPHLFKDNEMRNFNLGDCVTHPEHQITGTVISERGANGHYKVLMDDGRDHVFHEDEITLKNNMTELEKAEKRIPMIVKFIQQFLATDLAQQLSPAQRDAINKPGNYTTCPKLTEKLIKDDLERQAMEFINATKEKQATNIIPTSATQQSETVESNTQPCQEVSQTATEIVPQVELAQLVRNTNAIIEINVVSAIEYIDSRVTTFVGESEALEAELKKWFKDLAARRLDLTRPVKESLQTAIDDEKRIGAHLEKIFAANAAKREAAEKDRKAKKYTEVMATMADMLNAVDLPPEYLAKVVFREEYYQVTFKGKKLAESIQEQINTQVSLYSGYLAELELKQARIANRELLIKSYNIQYDADGTYSMFTIEMFSDDQVLAKYEQNYQRKLELAKIKQEKADAEKIKNEVKTEAVAESSTLPVVNVSLPYSPMGGQQKHSTPQANIESSPPAINSSSTETETVIMFKLVVTGRTQADHERLLPKFIDKINAAVDGGLAPAVNAGFGYKFEVVE